MQATHLSSTRPSELEQMILAEACAMAVWREQVEKTDMFCIIE
jgi:hypothetical protein